MQICAMHLPHAFSRLTMYRRFLEWWSRIQQIVADRAGFKEPKAMPRERCLASTLQRSRLGGLRNIGRRRCEARLSEAARNMHMSDLAELLPLEHVEYRYEKGGAIQGRIAGSSSVRHRRCAFKERVR